ncbi:MAG: S46 family peptidase [Bacteroidia bacterium]|nr:S46 family peptidase [Bacteroidia bacterium]MCF8445682.1 S46 family peptidase [Bacteroidia bacterium]
MKKFLHIIAVMLLLVSGAKADEGMWLPMLLKKYNYEQMKAKGLKLTPEQLYDVNNSSLKDAIVWFNGGCTGEIISSKGLVLTNHHCGYDAIASNSTPENNRLDNGFWAKNNGEEIPIAGMWVSIVQRMEDMTDRVQNELKGVSEKDRPAKLQEIFKKITTEATAGTTYEAQMREMFRGNAYYLFIFQRFTDIRLVGTPPQSVGKFGGDADNWMWPRHTGDFSMFRIYANKNNEASGYAPDNIPYTPKHSLPINIKGVKEGDYAMIYGFPGRTNRYEFSQGIDLAIEKVNPTIVNLRDIRLKAWKEVMDKNEGDRLKLSADYAQIANYWKYFIGQTEQMKRLKVYDFKVASENKFNEFAKGKPEFQDVIANVEKAYVAYRPIALQRIYLGEGILGVSMNSMSTSLFAYAKNAKDNKDTAAANKAIKGAQAGADEFYNSFFPSADEKILAQILEMYYNNIPVDQHPAYMAVILKSKGATTAEKFRNYSKLVYAKSFLASKEKFDAFTKAPSYKKLMADPCFAMTYAFYNHYLDNYKAQIDAFNAAIAPEARAYIKGLMEMNPSKTFYPDANSSLRLTYGSVQAYEPKDAVKFDYMTTLDGVIEKYNPKDFEFNAPQKLIDLYNAKDFGNYKREDGRMPVAFITNNDITGGNSGSPVIDGEGRLIGLAFDGNWEAMSGDIVFDEKYKRTINVDIRYVMFLIDKLGGAPHIVAEMNLVQ